MQYNKTELKNGLRIVSARMDTMRSVALGIWILTGGRYETAANAGISHFLEHLLFKGTKRRSAQRIKEEIEGIGGGLNGFTSEEFTCYFAKVPAKHTNGTLDVLADIVKEARLDAQDVEKERTVILEEIKMYHDLPGHYVQELLNELMWTKQPLGMNLTGTIESVRALNRQSLLDYRDKFYNPANIVVAAGGLVEHKRLSEEVARHFGGPQAGEKTHFKEAFALKRKGALKLYHKETEQTHLAFGFYSYPRMHPDRHALSILNIILGGNMSSRLFQVVRERHGLAYEIHSHLRRFMDTGAFVISAGVDNHKVERSVKIVLKELSRIKTNLVKGGEFERAKEYLIGQTQLALENTMDHMMWAGESECAIDRIYTFEEMLREIERVTIEDVKKVASDIFRLNKLNLALIGPVSKKEKPIYEGLHSFI